jgi:hypothetical protein
MALLQETGIDMTAQDWLMLLDGLTARWRGARTYICIVLAAVSVPAMQLLAALGVLTPARAIEIGGVLVALFNALAAVFKSMSNQTPKAV